MQVQPGRWVAKTGILVVLSRAIKVFFETACINHNIDNICSNQGILIDTASSPVAIKKTELLLHIWRTKPSTETSKGVSKMTMSTHVLQDVKENYSQWVKRAFLSEQIAEVYSCLQRARASNSNQQRPALVAQSKVDVSPANNS